MNSQTTQKLLMGLRDEIQQLRKEVAMVIPSESLDEFENKRAIQSAYKKASREYAPLWK